MSGVDREVQMVKIHWMMLVFALGLTGCAQKALVASPTSSSSEEARAESATVRGPASIPEEDDFPPPSQRWEAWDGMGAISPPYRAPEMERAPTLVRSFAGPDTPLEPMPTAIVVFNIYKPERNTEVCKAFLKLETRTSFVARQVLPGPAIVTRLPLKGGELDPTKLGDCGYILKNYDYSRAEEMLERAGLTLGDGPVFLAILPFLDPESGEQAFVALDSSQVPLEQLEGLAEVWKAAAAAAAQNPAQDHARAARSKQPDSSSIPTKGARSREPEAAGSRVDSLNSNQMAEVAVTLAAAEITAGEVGPACARYSDGLRTTGRFLTYLAVAAVKAIPQAVLLVTVGEALAGDSENDKPGPLKQIADASGQALVDLCEYFARRSSSKSPTS